MRIASERPPVSRLIAAAALPYAMRYARQARRGVKRARSMKSRSMTRTMQKRQRKTSGLGVTFEHDRQPIYLRKKMPYKKKKQWVQFNKKVNAVAEKELGTRTVVFNTQFFESNSVSDNHGVTNLQLYSLKSNASFRNDLNTIAGLENQGDPTAADGETIDLTTKCIFQSGVLDMTIRNTSIFSVDGELNTACTLETDVYEVLVGKTGRDNVNGSYVNLESFFNVGSNDTKNIGGNTITGTGVVIQKRGVTPFDIPAALSRHKIKIIRKTKYFIRNGQQITYQYRDPKRHVCTYGAMREQEGCNKPGMTKHILIIFKAIPGISVGLLPGETTEQLSIGVTRKYMYKIEGMNKSRDLYLNQ